MIAITEDLLNQLLEKNAREIYKKENEKRRHESRGLMLQADNHNMFKKYRLIL